MNHNWEQTSTSNEYRCAACPRTLVTASPEQFEFIKNVLNDCGVKSEAGRPPASLPIYDNAVQQQVVEALNDLASRKIVDSFADINTRLCPTIATWFFAGRPIRSADNVAAILATPCCNRENGTLLCRGLGCGFHPNKQLTCEAVAKMATTNCPAGLFAAGVWRDLAPVT